MRRSSNQARLALGLLVDPAGVEVLLEYLHCERVQRVASASSRRNVDIRGDEKVEIDC